MGSIEQEKEYLYWLCRSLPAFAVDDPPDPRRLTAVFNRHII